MNLITRFLTTMAVEHREVPRPPQAAASLPSPYGHHGRLVCVPWEGLYLEESG
ncbi:hypothetical protein [Sinomonas mesophila]|uniref:hypothetical protein n=1 Tax=Sinomonas mesophila TaxID=1531955 RepID=UPI001589AF05|nr:hypothetical protein [Sinomonas mesophila]